MIAKCHHCGEETLLEPFSMLCIDCLVEMAKRTKVVQKPPTPVPDFKAAQAGDD